MSEQLGLKYSNITKLNKKVDLLGYFAGIKKIEDDEYKMSSIFLIISLLLISIAFSISRNTTMDHFFSIVFLIMGAVSLYATFTGERKHINTLLVKRVNEDDTKKLMSLRENGEDTRMIVDKILSESKNGLLTYEHIAMHMEDLVFAYNKERSQQLEQLFNETTKQ